MHCSVNYLHMIFPFNPNLLPSLTLRFNVVFQAWVWKTQADFADALCEEDKPKQEVVKGKLEYELTVLEFQTLAIRFATVDNAEAFKAAFLEARQYVLENQVGLGTVFIF